MSLGHLLSSITLYRNKRNLSIVAYFASREKSAPSPALKPRRNSDKVLLISRTSPPSPISLFFICAAVAKPQLCLELLSLIVESARRLFLSLSTTVNTVHLLFLLFFESSASSPASSTPRPHPAGIALTPSHSEFKLSACSQGQTRFGLFPRDGPQRQPASAHCSPAAPNPNAIPRYSPVRPNCNAQTASNVLSSLSTLV